ncbi:tetratricopeptide repeat protein [uncultured Pseudodesulfovibrio sp.]|uniref:tetratricopeptide repeat protein n=1 Tax=uncultured Pseudodesulfovibrio sp. TaxID=2035858 RepID=UPI0029C7A240|nr:tetratricopeptide repeat protein [uncultured Pseudodesulfovibrio sp.]
MTEQSEYRSSEAILEAIKRVEQEAPGGAEALFMAAMLADSPLPYDYALSMDGTPHNPALINPAAAFFAATALIDPLVTNGLVDVDADSQIFALKDDVRVELRVSMTEEQTLDWAGRAIYGLNLALPDAEPQNWPTVQWLMPHILACRDLVKELGVNTAAANRVMHQAGFSLYHQQRYNEAVELLEAAMAVDVELKGGQHPDIVSDLEGLATVYWAAEDFDRAEATFMACLELQKEIFTEGNVATAPILNSLGVIRQARGRLDEAKATFEECLTVLRATQGEAHPATASCLSNMALLYEAMDEPEHALELAEQGLAINRRLYGDHHPEVAGDHNTVALLHDRLGNAAKAEEHFRISLAIREQVYGPDHPETAQAMCNMGLLLDSVGRYEEAFDYFDNGLAAYEYALGAHHPLMEPALDNFIALLEKLVASGQEDLRVRAEARLQKIVERAG